MSYREAEEDSDRDGSGLQKRGQSKYTILNELAWNILAAEMAMGEGLAQSIGDT